MGSVRAVEDGLPVGAGNCLLGRLIVV